MSEPALANNDDWRRHLIEDMRGIRRVLEETRRIAVLGIKIEESGAPGILRSRIRATRRIRDRTGAGVLPGLHGDSRREGLSHRRRDSGRRSTW